MQRKLLTTLSVLALLHAGTAFAEASASWELGLGVFGLHLPDYRGSAESRNYVYPLPYITYRGRVLQVDREEGARARFFELGRVRLDLSLYATPPVHSQDNQARQNMPDLDPTVEIGPMLNISVANPSPQSRLELRLPARAVIATNLTRASIQGWVFYPHLNFETSSTPWKFTVQGGPLFGTKKYHQYFYSVDQQFASPTRPAYSAPGGYSGLTGLVSLSRRVGRLWFGSFVRYDTVNHAVFEASPLVTRDHTLMFGAGIAWVFAESDPAASDDRRLAR